jgi:hypothetical protein
LKEVVGMFSFRTQKSDVGTLLSEEREILNRTLEAVLQSSNDSAAFIRDFLSRKYPDLINEELAVYTRICRSVVRHGHDLLRSVPDAEQRGKALPMWQGATLAQFPWIDDANLPLLFSNDAYHAENDTLPELGANSIPGYGLTL